MLLEEQDRRIARLAEILKAAGHPTRLEIISLLEDVEVPVGALQDQLEYPYSVISHHLSYLRRARIVIRTRRGTSMFYKLADTRLLPLIKAL